MLTVSSLKSKFLHVVGLQTPAARLAVFSLITVVVYFVDVPTGGLPNLSIYSNLHIPSPSIGLTRAYWFLLHGDPLAALRMNILIYPVVIVVVGMVVGDVTKLVRTRGLSSKNNAQIH